MRARAGRTLVIGFLLATFAVPVPLALAQDAPAAPPADLVPPKLAQGATPEYPESKKASAEKASVTLSLTIAKDGSVEAVSVTTSAGPEFDDAAVAAAKKLTFSPATRDGKPIPARIPYRFDFAFEAPPVVVTPAADAVVLEGTVRTAGDEPVPGATVTAASANGQPSTTTTDAAGVFRFKGLAPGSYQVTTAAEGFEPFASKEDVVAGEVATVTYRPKAIVVTSPDAPQEIRVVGERPAREVTRRALEQREIARIPGTNGDAIRAIENMPGVARPPGLQGLLIVRGSAPQDTGIFVDGTQVPIAFHFGGVSSVIPSALLERIDFLPGNFGPEYGRSMGGNVDIGLRSPARDKVHAMAQIDLIDARFVFEAPLGEKTRFLVAGRRSHVDAWIGGVLQAGGAVGVRTAPVYYDYQAMLEHDVTSSTTARLTVFGSDDALRLTLNSTGGDPALAGNFDNYTRFFRVQARTDTRVNDSTRWINTVSYGRDMQRITIGNNFSLSGALNPLTVRSDLRAKLADSVTAIVGIDTVWSTLDATVNSTPVPEDGQNTGPIFGRQRNLQTVSTSVLQPAGYAMLEVSPVKPLKLLPSVRADYSSDIKEWAGEPPVRGPLRHRERLSAHDPQGRRRPLSPAAAALADAASVRHSRPQEQPGAPHEPRVRAGALPPGRGVGGRLLQAARQPRRSARRCHPFAGWRRVHEQRVGPHLRRRAPPPLQAGREVLRLDRLHASRGANGAPTAPSHFGPSTTTRPTSSPRSGATASGGAGSSARAGGT